MNLQEELDELDGERNPHKRGKKFEQFLAHLLREEGFSVTYNPPATPPVQTDLSARRGHVYFIVEAKWLRRRLDVGSVASVRDRLTDMPREVFACVFSMSGYSTSAADEFCRDRSRETILFDGREIRAIVRGDLSFEELLNDKRDSLRTYKGMWFWDPKGGYPTSLHEWSAPGGIRQDGVTTRWLRCETGNDDALFSAAHLDFRGRQGAPGYSIYMRADPRSLSELGRLLKIADGQLGLSAESSFAIHQRDVGWFGHGTENFLAAVENRDLRYRELDWESYHHSEEIGFVSAIVSGGMFCLSSRQSTVPGNHVHSTEIEILLPGIPVETGQIKRFSRKMGNPDAIFEAVVDRNVYTRAFRPKVEVEPVAACVSDSREKKWASGLVVRNPFFRKPPPFAENLPVGHLFGTLSSQEFLFCSLRSWHAADVLMDRYRLCFVDGGFLGNYPTFWIVCDWT